MGCHYEASFSASQMPTVLCLTVVLLKKLMWYNKILLYMHLGSCCEDSTSYSCGGETWRINCNVTNAAMRLLKGIVFQIALVWNVQRKRKFQHLKTFETLSGLYIMHELLTIFYNIFKYQEIFRINFWEHFCSFLKLLWSTIFINM